MIPPGLGVLPPIFSDNHLVNRQQVSAPWAGLVRHDTYHWSALPVN